MSSIYATLIFEGKSVHEGPLVFPPRPGDPVVLVAADGMDRESYVVEKARWVFGPQGQGMVIELMRSQTGLLDAGKAT